MKTTLSILALTATAALAGCGGGAPTDQLAMGNEISYYPGALATPQNTQQHHQEVNLGQHGVTDPMVVEKLNTTVGSVEVEARLHSCTKISYTQLGNLLTSRGINVTNTQKGSAGLMYVSGTAALGVSDYAARVPEMSFPSTATEAKQMDIFIQAAAEIPTTTAFDTTTGCSGVSLLDTTGAFTKDGISCLMGKPATDAHLNLANQILTEAPDPTTGAQLAISALLEAAHTCQ